MNTFIAVFITVSFILEVTTMLHLCKDMYIFGFIMDWDNLTFTGKIINIVWVVYTIPARLLFLIMILIVFTFVLICNKEFTFKLYKNILLDCITGNHVII